MDLANINVGVVANDGTGDSPRASWLKQMANNRALKAGVEQAAAGAAAAVDSASVEGIRDAGEAGRQLLRASSFDAAREAVGLGNVANLAPSEMPVSAPQQSALDDLAAYKYPLPQVMRRTKDAKLGDAAPTPFDFANLVVNGDWTAAVQAGLNASAGAQLPLALFRVFPVTRLTVPRFASIHSGGGELRAIGTGPRDSINALLDLPDGNVVVHGRLVINGQYNLAYRRGVHNFGQQSQFSFPTNLGINGFQVGYTHGAREFPFGILSEATITGLYTYGCPICVEVIGTETIVNFVGCPLISDMFGAPASWSSLPRRVVRSIGAIVYFTAGQACITDTVNGYVAEMQPLDSTRPTIEGCRYGAVRFFNLEIETASPFLLAHNPAGLTINSPASRAQFCIEGCGGFVSQDQAMSFIADDCPIDIVIGESNEFPYPGGTRTQPTWFVNGTSGRAHIYLPSRPMGMNWRDPLAEVVNGVAHWKGERTIFRALNPGAQAFTANTAAAVLYGAVDQANGLNRFATGYNASTGRWQVQQVGGLKDATAVVSVAFTSAVSGRVALINQAGVEVATAPIAAGFGSLTADIGPMANGDFLYVSVTVNANAVLVSDTTGGGARNKLTIKARN